MEQEKNMKKLIEFIFETEEIVEEETKGPLKTHTFTEVEKPVQTKEVVKEVKKEENVQEKVIAQKQEAVKRNDVLTKTKPAFGIDMDDYPVKKTVKAHNPKKQDTAVKYESKPPMSPIFGVLESKKDPRIIVTPSTTKQVNSLNSSKIGTVLSPIYGVIQTNEESAKDEVEVLDKPSVSDITHIKEIKEEIEQISLIQEDEIPTATKQNDYFNDYFTNKEVVEDNFANGSLEEILIKPKDETYIMNQDISLFDDEME